MPPSPHPLGLRLAGPLLLAWLACAAPAALAAPEAEPPAVPVHKSLDPLRPWLRNGDWTVRSLAAFELRTRTEAGVVHLCAQLLAAEKHPYAAAGALGALRGRPRHELVLEGGAVLVEALLRWADHEHPTLSAYALEVLQRIPPVRLGNDLARYRGWWLRGRDALLREQRALLASAAKGAAKDPAPTQGGSSTSPASKRTDEHVYGRLETMRKHGLDLCIVMDNTGSMGPVIGAAKAGAARLIARLHAYVPRFRAALVTYGEGARLWAPLTDNAAILRKKIGKVGAGGGGDLEEDVDRGVALALKQDTGWTAKAYRVIVVVGDAPPHEADVPRLLRAIGQARQDVLFDHAVVVHAVSTDDLPVLHFPQIALAGGGQHVTLATSGRLVEELVLLTFGGADRARIRTWMVEIDKLRADERPQRRRR